MDSLSRIELLHGVCALLHAQLATETHSFYGAKQNVSGRKEATSR